MQPVGFRPRLRARRSLVDLLVGSASNTNHVLSPSSPPPDPGLVAEALAQVAAEEKEEKDGNEVLSSRETGRIAEEAGEDEGLSQQQRTSSRGGEQAREVSPVLAEYPFPTTMTAPTVDDGAVVGGLDAGGSSSSESMSSTTSSRPRTPLEIVHLEGPQAIEEGGQNNSGAMQALYYEPALVEPLRLAAAESPTNTGDLRLSQGNLQGPATLDRPLEQPMPARALAPPVSTPLASEASTGTARASERDLAQVSVEGQSRPSEAPKQLPSGPSHREIRKTSSPPSPPTARAPDEAQPLVGQASEAQPPLCLVDKASLLLIPPPPPPPPPKKLHPSSPPQPTPKHLTSPPTSPTTLRLQLGDSLCTTDQIPTADTPSSDPIKMAPVCDVPAKNTKKNLPSSKTQPLDSRPSMPTGSTPRFPPSPMLLLATTPVRRTSSVSNMACRTMTKGPRAMPKLALGLKASARVSWPFPPPPNRNHCPWQCIREK